jgi:transposase
MKKTLRKHNEFALIRQDGLFTIGIDLGDRTSHYCTLTDNGDVLVEGRLKSTPTAFRDQFASFPKATVA